MVSVLSPCIASSSFRAGAKCMAGWGSRDETDPQVIFFHPAQTPQDLPTG